MMKVVYSLKLEEKLKKFERRWFVKSGILIQRKQWDRQHLTIIYFQLYNFSHDFRIGTLTKS